MNMYSSLFPNVINWISGDVAIDLGTANTLIWLKGRGIVVNEPSIVTRNVHNDTIVAVGDEAKAMLGKTHRELETIRPLQDGVIADFAMTDGMLQGFIRKINLNRLARPRMVICVPSGVTEVERRAVKDSGERANAREVYLIEEPVAAAIGIGLDISQPIGNIIVDIGGGTTEIAVISLNGVVTKETIRIAGDEMDEAVLQWFRNEHKLEIGLGMSEKINYAFILIIIIALTDFLDGYVARKVDETTNFGKLIDPVADKICMMVVLVYLIIIYKLPFLLFCVTLAIRDIFLIIIGIFLMFQQDEVFQSNKSGKWFIGISALMMVFFLFKDPIGIPDYVLVSSYAISVFLFTISTYEYIRRYLKYFKELEIR